ncbi:unnamed protein product, partial [Effrenium voratum]
SPPFVLVRGCSESHASNYDPLRQLEKTAQNILLAARQKENEQEEQAWVQFAVHVTVFQEMLANAGSEEAEALAQREAPENINLNGAKAVKVKSQNAAVLVYFASEEVVEVKQEKQPEEDKPQKQKEVQQDEMLKVVDPKDEKPQKREAVNQENLLEVASRKGDVEKLRKVLDQEKTVQKARAAKRLGS